MKEGTGIDFVFVYMESELFIVVCGSGVGRVGGVCNVSLNRRSRQISLLFRQLGMKAKDQIVIGYNILILNA